MLSVQMFANFCWSCSRDSVSCPLHTFWYENKIALATKNKIVLAKWWNYEIILFWSYYAKKLTIIIKLPKEEFEVQEGTRMIDYWCRLRSKS